NGSPSRILVRGRCRLFAVPALPRPLARHPTQIVNLDSEAMLLEGPFSHGQAPWLRALPNASGAGDEDQTFYGVARLLGNDCLKDVFLKLRSRVWQTQRHFNNRRFFPEVEIDGKAVLTRNLLLAQIRSE